MPEDRSLDGRVKDGGTPAGCAPVLVLVAIVVLIAGAVALLDAWGSDKEGDNLDAAGSPRSKCEHLYREIPIDATEFDPTLNAEHRSCTARETRQRYLLIASPFLLVAVSCLALAGWMTLRRKHQPR